MKKKNAESRKRKGRRNENEQKNAKRMEKNAKRVSCSVCHSSSPAEDKFCRYCGEVLGNESSKLSLLEQEANQLKQENSEMERVLLNFTNNTLPTPLVLSNENKWAIFSFPFLNDKFEINHRFFMEATVVKASLYFTSMLGYESIDGMSLQLLVSDLQRNEQVSSSFVTQFHQAHDSRTDHLTFTKQEVFKHMDGSLFSIEVETTVFCDKRGLPFSSFCIYKKATIVSQVEAIEALKSPVVLKDVSKSDLREELPFETVRFNFLEASGNIFESLFGLNQSLFPHESGIQDLL